MLLGMGGIHRNKSHVGENVLRKGDEFWWLEHFNKSWTRPFGLLSQKIEVHISQSNWIAHEVSCTWFCIT